MQFGELVPSCQEACCSRPRHGLRVHVAVPRTGPSRPWSQNQDPQPPGEQGLPTTGSTGGEQHRPWKLSASHRPHRKRVLSRLCVSVFKILHSTGLEFQHQVEEAKDLDQLIKIHYRYLSTIHDRCLLREKVHSVTMSPAGRGAGYVGASAL